MEHIAAKGKYLEFWKCHLYNNYSAFRRGLSIFSAFMGLWDTLQKKKKKNSPLQKRWWIPTNECTECKQLSYLESESDLTRQMRMCLSYLAAVQIMTVPPQKQRQEQHDVVIQLHNISGEARSKGCKLSTHRFPPAIRLSRLLISSGHRATVAFIWCLNESKSNICFCFSSSLFFTDS